MIIYPEVVLSRVVHVGTIWKNFALVRPWTLNVGCSMDCDSTSSGEAEVSAIRSTTDQRRVVGIGTSTTASERVRVGQDGGGQRYNARQDSSDSHLEGEKTGSKR